MTSKEQPPSSDTAASKRPSPRPGAAELDRLGQEAPPESARQARPDSAALPPHAMLELQRTIGNQAVRKLISDAPHHPPPASPHLARQDAGERARPIPAAIQRTPEDFKTALALDLSAGWGFLGVGSTPWGRLKDTITAYAALGEDKLVERARVLAQMEENIREWERHHAIATKRADALKEDEKKKITAIADLRQDIEGEWEEVGTKEDADTLDPRSQQVGAIRFQGDLRLEMVMQGKTQLNQGQEGLSVLKVKQALADAGKLAPDKVSDQFDADTEAALKVFQTAAGLPPTGVVTPQTMQALDRTFRTYKVEAKAATSVGRGEQAPPESWDVADTPAELLAGTRAVGLEEAAVAKAINISSVGSADVKPPFIRIVAGQDYKNRVKHLAEAYVLLQYRSIGEGKAAKRSDPANLHSWNVIEAVAKKSKQATDNVFGKYAIGSEPKQNITLFDKWEHEEGLMGASEEYKTAKARWRVQKIVQGTPEIRQVDKEHGADQARDPEKAIIDEVIDELVAAHKDKLLETHKGWPGSQAEGKIYLQRYKAETAKENRAFMWNLFRTVIHEYIHSLEHPQSREYRAGLGEQAGNKVIREGVVDYFTKIVWEQVDFNATLRQAVEGPYYVAHDPWDVHGQAHGIYDEAANAERVAGLVGIKNLYAAFFLGHVDKIGG